MLAQAVSGCCVGARSAERLAATLLAVDPPYLTADQLDRLRGLPGEIAQQVRSVHVYVARTPSFSSSASNSSSE